MSVAESTEKKGLAVVSSARLLLAVVLIAGAQAGVYLIDRGWTPAPAKVPDVDFDSWPLELGKWQGQPIEVEEDGKAAVCGNWVYQNDVGKQISLLVGVWTEYTVVVPHSPEYCYKAAGWKPANSKDVDVAVPGGETIKARLVFFDRDTERVAVLFWYQIGDRIVRESEELRRLQQQIRGRVSELPPAVKIMLHTSAFDADEVESRLTGLASLVAVESMKIH